MQVSKPLYSLSSTFWLRICLEHVYSELQKVGTWDKDDYLDPKYPLIYPRYPLFGTRRAPLQGHLGVLVVKGFPPASSLSITIYGHRIMMFKISDFCRRAEGKEIRTIPSLAVFYHTDTRPSPRKPEIESRR